jgi:hypothetical protein
VSSPRVMEQAARLVAEIVDGAAYITWYDRESDEWIAIRANHYGLSGISKTPEGAMTELMVAINLANEVRNEG